jgi:hypothetical protein
MPFFAANLISTARATRNNTTGQTGVEQPYLSGIPAHVANNAPNAMTILPEPAMKASYYAYVDTGTDIVEGDTITSITLLDGQTPWPAIRPGPQTQMPGVQGASNLIYKVVYTMETSAALLPMRIVWFEYIVGGGPTS